MSTPPKPLQATLLSTPDETEAQFYEALQTANVERLMQIWADDEDIACIHPGGVRLVGAAAIRAAFGEMLGQSGVDVRCAQVRRLTLGQAAVHHVLEEVRVQTEAGPRTGYVLATNVYVKTPLGWRMLVHHASPGTPAELQALSDAPATLH